MSDDSKKMTIWLSLVLLVFGVACGFTDYEQTNGSNQNSNENQQASKYEIPAGISNMFSDEELDRLIDEGLVLNEGDDPPTTEGTFLPDTETVIYDSNGEKEGEVIPYYNSYSWSFTNQSDGTMDVAYVQQDGDDSTSGLGAVIAGEGDCFTIGAEVEGVNGDGCTYKRGHLISGCISEAGIEDWQNSYGAWKPGGGPEADEGECPADEEKYFEMLEETDGLADRVD